MLFLARKGKFSRFCPFSRKRLIHRIIYTNKNNNVMNKKSLYAAPDSELLLVRFEENIMSVTPNGSKFKEPADVDDQSDQTWWQ